MESVPQSISVFECVNRVTYVGREEKGRKKEEDICLVDWISFDGVVSRSSGNTTTEEICYDYKTKKREGQVDENMLLRIKPQHVVASYSFFDGD